MYQKFEQQAAVTPTRYEIRCQLLLITTRKSHTGFRLVPTWVTRTNPPYSAVSLLQLSYL